MYIVTVTILYAYILNSVNSFIISVIVLVHYDMQKVYNVKGYRAC